MEAYRVLVYNPFNIFDKSTYLPLLIRFVYRTIYRGGILHNHAAFLIKIGRKWYIIHAVDPVVEIVEWSEWLSQRPRGIIIQHVKTKRTFFEILERAISMIGRKYDRWSLLWYLPIYLRSGVWFGHSEPFAAKEVYCFELPETIFGGPNPQLVSPVV